MRIRASLLALSAVPWVALVATPYQAPSPKAVDFTKDILPIFRAQCFGCHSGEAKQGGLLLDGKAEVLKGGVSGPMFVAGKGQESYLVQRLLGKGGKPQMPMGFKPMTAKQIETIVAWIDQGGSMPNAFTSHPHWAYEKPLKAPLPAVREATWIRNPIDRFVLARLEKEGLKPSLPASKPTLLRRVSLDLTGLPPTPAEIDAFLADKSPQAYDRVIDRLLASPHYGERMARVWLDLARYADTDGYEKDPSRTAWVYRDWVINAYNRNLPYDQFTVQQLAGDMLPAATLDQLVATGFHRNTMRNTEGGVDQDEARYEVILDRVGTTSEVWLGSTMACARCHDHKYDPISQRDFFRMYAFFGNTEYSRSGPASVGEEKTDEPVISVPTAEQEVAARKLNADLEAAKSERNRVANGGFEAWKARLQTPVSWLDFRPQQASSASGQTLVVQPDGSVLASGTNPPKDVVTVTGKLRPGPVRAVRISALPDPSIPASGPGRSGGGNFVVTGIELTLDGRAVPLAYTDAKHSQSGYPARRVLRGGSGWAIAPQTGREQSLVVVFAEEVRLADLAEAKLVIRTESPYAGHNLGRFKVTFSDDADALRETVSTANEEAYFRSDPKVLAAQSKVEQLESNIAQLRRSMPTAMILRERKIDGVPAAWFRNRGEFLGRQSLVSADVPAFLGRMRPGQPRNRLGLAQWIASRDNPLTARVQVNRTWETLFGRGIVATSEDFGTQSSPPTHPELLDWLAVEFMDRKWDQKALLRLIVTSATYRQSSATTPALTARDPNNELLARGPRFRMEAEMIRDTMLAASGLLNPKVGGPSVYPTQPEGIWDSPYSGEQWRPSKDGDEHRRGLYTFWKRTSPYPKFMVFDASSREQCTIRRSRTNTPLQALAMLNDDGTMEASRALAKRMAAQKPERRLAYGFRRCTGRWPTPAERARLTGLHNRLATHYQNRADEAKKVAGTPENAALTMVANALLNLDETLNKS